MTLPSLGSRISRRILKRFVPDPGYGGARIVVREPSIDDVFLELTGRVDKGLEGGRCDKGKGNVPVSSKGYVFLDTVPTL